MYALASLNMCLATNSGIQEDDLLFLWVEKHGPTKWTECSKQIKGRCGKQCRERWVNILNPEVKKGNWSDHEQDVIFNNLSTYNTSWSAMSHILPGRTENSIKNYFYSSIRRLKSNNLIHLLKSIYIYKKATSEQIFEDNPNILNDINKLNRLSQKICFFLFEKSDKNDNYLLIFDQFEEFFTYPLVQQEAFKIQLAELLYTDMPQSIRDILSNRNSQNRQMQFFIYQQPKHYY